MPPRLKGPSEGTATGRSPDRPFDLVMKVERVDLPLFLPGDRLPPTPLAHLDQQHRVVTVHRLQLPVVQNDVLPVDRIAVGGQTVPLAVARTGVWTGIAMSTPSPAPGEARGLESLEDRGLCGDAVGRRTEVAGAAFSRNRNRAAPPSSPSRAGLRAAGADDASAGAARPSPGSARRLARFARGSPRSRPPSRSPPRAAGSPARGAPPWSPGRRP
jgi:hypothetical protein